MADEVWQAAADGIQEAIQTAAPAVATNDEGSVVTGWALVVEWMDPNGTRWLSRLHPPNVTSWLASGLHHEALNGEWPDG